MTRSLQVIEAENVGEVFRRLRVALAADGPAVLPRATAVHGHENAGLMPTTVENHIALVVETSGSMGAPKRVVLSRDALLASAASSASVVEGQGQWLLCLPTHYVAGSNVLVRSIAAQTEPVLMPSGHFEPAVFSEVASTMTHDFRYVSLVPVQLARLIEHSRTDAGLRRVLRRFDRILVGGQSLSPQLSEQADDAGLHITRTYGASETCGGCVYDGSPIGTTRVRVNEGMLELSGPVLAEGYLDDALRTKSSFYDDDGVRWYRTGDLGTVDDGVVKVLGRADNVIISGGEKVLLDAVERRVRELPGMANAIVVGAKDATWGQVPVVIATENTLELEALRAHVSTVRGRAAAPSRVIIIEAMPRLPSGKPDRHALARLVESQRPPDIGTE